MTATTTIGKAAILSPLLTSLACFGTDGGKPLECTHWFSDTYVRTATGWRYVFGQSSMPLPKTK